MRHFLQALVVLTASVAALAPVDPRLVERWYSLSIYPLVQRTVTPVSNLVPLALFDVLTITAAAVALALAVRLLLQARREGRWRAAARGVATLVTTAAVAYLAFLALWGFNYRRLPMTDRLVLDEEPPSPAAVIELGLTAADRLRALHSAAHDEGWRTAPWREHQLREAYATVQRMLSDGTPTVPGRLKSSIYGPYFRWAAVDGMINPFGLEIIGNPDLLEFEQPFVAAHEWAHLAGYADESEASFVGWLTCVHASPASAYSGWLFLYWQIQAELGADEREQLAGALTEGPRRDLEAIADRLRRGELRMLRRASWQVYDRYLKANRVDEGTGSYGAVVELILRSRFDDDWTPQRAVGSRQ